MYLPWLLPLLMSMVSLRISTACSSTSVLSSFQSYKPSSFNVRECGQRPLHQDLHRQKRVTNGHDAILGQWPWHVSIKQDGGLPCSGVLIDSDWALTAAHCFYNPSERKVALASNLSVTAGTLGNGLGDTKHSEGSQTVRVREVYMHPRYATEVTIHNYDFLMLKLAEPFIIGPKIQTACLQIVEDMFQPGAECYVAGWGKHFRTNIKNQFADTLQYSSVQYLPKPDCRYYAGNVSKYQLSLVTEQKLCAGVWSNDFYGPCKGDSGGPLVCYENNSSSWYVVGIVSHGPKCGEIGFYTKMHAMLGYIEDVISGNVSHDSFECYNGTDQILIERKCDGVVDCEDASDEIYCECTENQFRCDNGICRMKADLCDAEDNCGDESDEDECEYFQCSDGKSISSEQKCNGIVNCEDRSDESPDICVCKATTQFQCPEGPCIPLTWTCDGEADCSDTTDELNCECRNNYFQCSNRRCVHEESVCNGINDCGDQSDETDCSTADHVCDDDGWIYCKVMGFCIPISSLSCDQETFIETCENGNEIEVYFTCMMFSNGVSTSGSPL